MAAAAATEKANGAMGARVVGEVVTRDLKKVKANPWNDNVMTPAEMESLKHGLVHDGWIASQALLIWGADERGVKRDIIIDGEHRWTAAREVGITKGPMVFLNGITEAEARKLTIKMNRKRGHADEDRTREALRWLEEAGEELGALDLGFGEEVLMQLLAAPEPELPGTTDGTNEPPPAGEGGAGAPSGASSGGAPGSPAPQEAQTRMVQLYLDSVTHPQFLTDCKRLSEVYGTQTITDTVLEAVRRAVAGLPEPK